MDTTEIPAVSPQNPKLPRSISPGRGKNIVKQAPATPAEVRALLFMVLDKPTADAMVKSLRKKIAKGNLGILEFLFDRIIGRPAVNVHHEADGALAMFMSSWAELTNLVQSEPLALDSASEVIDGDFVATKDDDNVEDAGTGI